jgi:hypothetical protein
MNPRFGLLILVGFGLAVCAAAPSRASDTFYVQVAETKLRAAAGFLSPPVGTLTYGDPVEKLAENPGGAWLRVRNPKSGEGWLHGSALSSTALVLKAGERSASTRAERAEPTLGGKGFTEEVEGDYKAKNPALMFDVLDRIEKERPSDEEVLSFAREGGLQK